MTNFIIEETDTVLINNAGLSFIGKLLKDKKVFNLVNKATKIKKRSGVISDYDIIKTFIALNAIGKTHYDDVEQYRTDRFFKKAIGVKKVPSAPTIRQRFETYGNEMHEVIRIINIEFIRNYFQDEYISIDNKPYIVLESDVTPLDNSKTKKEGVSRTYKNFFGFAPMMSYAGRSGFMINNELREGSAHSNCPGTIDYFTQTLDLTQKLGSNILAIMDSGNDDGKLVLHLKSKSIDFILKRNLRKELPEKYIDYAKEKAEKTIVNYPGSITYYARWTRSIEDQEIPIAVVVTENKIDKQGQEHLIPVFDIEVYWNSLNLSAEKVEEFYHQHGTSEQYHSEFKSDLDLERLPSNKFSSNYTIMLLGMVSFNLLRIVGKELLSTKQVPGRRGNRLRIRTVLQNVMYMAGQYVRHAGRDVIKLYRGNKWTKAFCMIM